MLKRNILLFALTLFCFLGAAIAAAGDPISVTVSSGLTSTVASAADTVSFNSGLPAGFSDNCSSSVDCGIFPSTTWTTDVHNPTNNTNDFIAPGINGQKITINLSQVQSSLGISSPIDYFGLYWGSVDTYNNVYFYDGSKLVASYTGSELLALDTKLTPGITSTYVNFYFTGGTVTSIDLWSGGENFETVNEAFAESPESGTLALMGIGLLGLGLLVRSRVHQLHR